MMAEEDLAEIYFDEQITETDKAILFNIEGEEVWVPKSLITYIDYYENYFEVYVWFAEKEELI